MLYKHNEKLAYGYLMKGNDFKIHWGKYDKGVPLFVIIFPERGIGTSGIFCHNLLQN